MQHISILPQRDVKTVASRIMGTGRRLNRMICIFLTSPGPILK